MKIKIYPEKYSKKIVKNKVFLLFFIKNLFERYNEQLETTNSSNNYAQQSIQKNTHCL